MCCGHKLVDFYFYATTILHTQRDRQTTSSSSHSHQPDKCVYFGCLMCVCVCFIFHASFAVNRFHLVVVFGLITLHQTDSTHTFTHFDVSIITTIIIIVIVVVAPISCHVIYSKCNKIYHHRHHCIWFDTNGNRFEWILGGMRKIIRTHG